MRAILRKTFTDFVRWVGYDLGITPNQITVGRLLFFVPGWLLWVYREELARRLDLPWQLLGWTALVVVTAVILLDLLDGALARETDQVSKHGKILDPAVDKFITYSTLALFWGAITQIGLVVLLLLDILSTFLRGVQVQGANEFGKKKALCQNLSKFFFGAAVLLPSPALNTAGNLLIVAALILATISVGIRLKPANRTDAPGKPL